MKRFSLIACALFALAAAGCDDTNDANAKIQQCLEDEYGVGAAEDLMVDWELTCDESDDSCRACIDCVMDRECGALLDGACARSCDAAEDIYDDTDV